MVLVFYFLCIVLMMTVRPFLNSQYLKNGKSAVYSALYFLPILALFHTVVGGLICKYQNICCRLSALFIHNVLFFHRSIQQITHSLT